MNQPARLLKLQEMLKDDPTDEFLRYGLAMEHRKVGQLQESIEILRGLMTEQPPHVPSFLMAGQQFVELGDVETARDVLREGIEAARRADDAHAAGEMSELLTSIGELGDG